MPFEPKTWKTPEIPDEKIEKLYESALKESSKRMHRKSIIKKTGSVMFLILIVTTIFLARSRNDELEIISKMLKEESLELKEMAYLADAKIDSINIREDSHEDTF